MTFLGCLFFLTLLVVLPITPVYQQRPWLHAALQILGPLPELRVGCEERMSCICCWCVCVSGRWVWAPVCVHLCVCTCVCACSTQSRTPCLSLNQSKPPLLAKLANLLGSTCPLPRARTNTHNHTQLFTWSLGIWTYACRARDFTFRAIFPDQEHLPTAGLGHVTFLNPASSVFFTIIFISTSAIKTTVCPTYDAMKDTELLLLLLLGTKACRKTPFLYLGLELKNNTKFTTKFFLFVCLFPFWMEEPTANRNSSAVLMGCLVLKYEDVSFLPGYSQNKPPS